MPAAQSRLVPASSRKVLVIMADYHFGDFIASLPVIEALAGHFEHGIDLVVRGAHVPLAQRLPSAGKIRIHNYRGGRKARDWRQHLAFLGLAMRISLARYRTVISISYRIPCSMLALMSLARQRIGLTTARRQWVYNDRLTPVAGPHKLDFYATVLQRIGMHGRPPLIGPEIDAASLAAAERLLAACSGGRRGYAVVHPFAGQAARNWPEGRFARIADELVTAYDLSVCLIGTPDQRSGLERLRTLMHCPDDALVITEPLPVTMALLVGMALFVGNLSGPAQLAGLVSEAPIVCVSGPADKVKWQPLRQGKNAIMLSGPLCPGRCRKAKCQDQRRCALEVQVDAVADAIRTVLSPSVRNQHALLRTASQSAGLVNPCAV